MGKLREGKNVLAVYVNAAGLGAYGLMPYCSYTVMANHFLPQPPGCAAPLDPRQVSESVYVFPVITNFTVPAQVGKKGNL
jgi:hypothetical protein